MKQLLKVAEIGEIISGTSSNGVDWEKQQVVFNTTDGENTMIAIDFMGERKTKLSKTLQVGQICEVNYSVESHPNQAGDKWYTNVNAISLVPLERVKKDDASVD